MHYRTSILWRKALHLAELACRAAGELHASERFGMRSQMTRAATSVVCNVAEGWNRESRKEKAQFLAIAQGSLAELHTQLLLCVRLGWLAPDHLDRVMPLADEVG